MRIQAAVGRFSARGGSRARAIAVFLALPLVVVACVGDLGDSGTGGEGVAEATADAGDEGSGAGDDVGDDGSASTDDASGSEASGDAPIGCEIVGDRQVEVTYTNPGPDPIDLLGELEVSAGSVSDVSSQSIRGVAPGEVVAVSRLISIASSDPFDACSTAGLTVESRADVDPVWAEDVGPCTDFRDDGLASSSVDLTVTNSSENLPAHYAIAVVVRDPAGRRVAETFVLAKESAADLAPGETATVSGSITFPFADFAADFTCEVAQVVRFTSAELLGDVGGQIRGSLESDVAFAVGSAELTSDGVSLVNQTVEDIIDYGGPVCIEGFADSVGDEDDNQLLSQARAETVVDQLRAGGAANEITALGRGESEATVDEVDDPSLRRVDIVLAPCSG